MHALSHSLAHRAPPATRTRVRWQPYGTLTQPIQPRSPPISYLNTPASSASSSPASSLSVCENDRGKHFLQSLPPTPKENPLRDSQKNKYVLGLVGQSFFPLYAVSSSCDPSILFVQLTSFPDQAVKSLCDIWPSQNIPSVFLMSSQTSSSVALAADSLSPTIFQPNQPRPRNTQLPSPISPSTQRSPVSPPSLTSPATSLPARSASSDQCPASSRTNLVPIKGFVHEVLRRSRTSGSVLQTALCYLEAIRAKVPELARLEQLGQGVRGELESGDRIVQADLESENGTIIDNSISVNPNNEQHTLDKDVMDVIPAFCGVSVTQTAPPSKLEPSQPHEPLKKPKLPSPPLAPLPPLPSPLPPPCIPRFPHPCLQIYTR